MEQMRDIYNTMSDKTEYADFEIWLHDMLKSGVFEETTEDSQKIKSIVDYMVKCGTEFTETGNYEFYYSELESAFGVSSKWLEENHKAIKTEIDCREEVLSETWDVVDALGYTVGFDINFCLDYCDITDLL